MLDLRSALLLNRYRLDGCAVQIPPSPQDHVAKRYRFLDTFCFFIPCRKLACRQRCKKQREWLATFCAVGLQGPLRRAEGKGVKRSDHRERSSQFSLSALNSLQGVDFQPCRLFLCPKSCTKNAPTPFLRTSTGVFQIAHIPYIISQFLIQPDSTKCERGLYPLIHI